MTDAAKAPRAGRKEWAMRLALLIASGLFSLAVLEAAVRIASPPPPFGPYFDLRPYKKLLLEPNLPGVQGPVRHTANKWGMRGEDPPKDWDGSFTILTVGGSTTQCFYLDDARAWPHLLQEKLRATCPTAWVGNAGLDGHSTRGHVMLMDAVISKLRPKMVVFLIGLNDLALSVAYDEKGSPFDAHIVQRMHPGAFRALLDKSRLFQIAAIWKRVVVDKAQIVAQHNHHRYVAVPLVGKEDSLPAPDIALPSLAPYLRNVDTLASKCRRLGIEPVFMTQPGLFSGDSAWKTIAGGMSFLSTSRWKISAATEYRLLRIFNDSLIARCRVLGLACLDLGARVPHDSAFFYDDYHFTDRGAGKVAEELGAYLQTLPSVRACRAKNAPEARPTGL